MRRLLVVLVLTATVVVGCTTARPALPPGRQASEAELRVLAQAVLPLLEESTFPLPQRPEDCRVGLVILASPAINAGAGPGTQKPCTFFALGVSEGAVRRLSVDMLRAMLAHELGHVELGHFEARRARGEVQSVFTRAFQRAEEAEADRFAVALLRKIEPRYPGACIALVYVLAILAEQPAGQGRWLATHPSPEHRAEVARHGCEAKTAPTF